MRRPRNRVWSYYASQVNSLLLDPIIVAFKRSNTSSYSRSSRYLRKIRSHGVQSSSQFITFNRQISHRRNRYSMKIIKSIQLPQH